MDLDKNVLIALLCGVMSMALSTLMPCVLKSSTNPLLVDARRLYDANRQVIVVSSLIVAITAYLALSLFPLLDDDSDMEGNVFSLSMGRQSGGSLMHQLINGASTNQLVANYH